MNFSFDAIEAWQTRKVLVLGEAMLDCYLQGTATRLCQEAPVPVVTVTQQQDYPGGAANTAANLVSLGGQAWLFSVVGRDPEAARLIKALEQRQIAPDHLLQSAEWNTIAKQRVLADAQLLVRFDQGSHTAISPALEKQLIQGLIERFHQADAVIVSDYGYGLLTTKVLQTLAVLQSQSPRTVVVDAKQLAAYRSIHATVVKPNYAEAIQLLGLPRLSQQRLEQIMPHGDRLLDLTGAAIVAVTLDTEGAILFEQGQPPLTLPTQPVPACQTSGAGDTFVSAFTLALVAGAATSEAAHLAMSAAALVVQQMGTSICTAADLQQYLQTHHSINSFPLSASSSLPSLKLYF